MPALPMTITRCLFVIAFLSTASFAQDLPAQTPATSSELNKILTQWRINEDRFQSLRCSWDETRVYLPGSVIPANVPGYGGIPEDSPIVKTGWPISEIAIEGPHLLFLSGVMMRNEEIMLGLPPDGGDSYRISRHLSSFDGEVSVSAGVGEDSRGSQVKRLGTSNIDALSRTWIPIRNIVRPLDPHFQKRPEDSLTCQQVNENMAVLRDAAYMEYSVDLNKDCLITRASQKHPQKGSLLWDYELTTELDPENVHIPAEWTFREWDGDRIVQTITATITEFSYREQLTKADFQLDLPESLELYDQRFGDTGDHGHVRMPTPVAQEPGTFNYFWLMVVLCVIFTAVVWQRYVRRKAL